MPRVALPASPKASSAELVTAIRELGVAVADPQVREDLVALLENRPVARHQRLGLDLAGGHLAGPGHLRLLADLPGDLHGVEALLGGLGGRCLVTAGGQPHAEERRDEEQGQAAQGRQRGDLRVRDGKYRAKP